MVYVKVSNIKIDIKKNDIDAVKKAMNVAKITENQLIDYKIIKKSIDARHKDQIKYIYTIALGVSSYNKKIKNINVVNSLPEYVFNSFGKTKLNNRPVVVGFGPAGMFCAYLLAKNGYKPIVIERGSKVDKRKEKIDKFWETGILDPNSNVQFGEGGAGTFSDGKLNTGIKDKFHRINYVLDTFVKYGAPENITYDAKPHVGTDILMDVVSNMRKAIEEMGGEFMFDTQVVDFEFENDSLKAVKLSNGELIDTNICVLAIGHSARDTFERLNELKIAMEPKPFAIGVRVEHLQSIINNSQYGFSDNRIGAAPYKLTYKANNGRGVYSFCMCPGGVVVNAASEDNRLVVNGMSYSDRNENNANSAIVVTVNPEDFYKTSPLDGVNYQRKLEEKAFESGNGSIPSQLFGDFKANKISNDYGKVLPCHRGKTAFGNINEILPDFICESIKEAMNYWDRVITGFADDDSILSAVESRTSSPVRIIRDDISMESNVKGLYPCGEGAGYAGGITSAAIDGIKIFEVIAGEFSPM